ncbi:MAG: tetratricopeptide repeat protein, partial [Bradymonadaceae bacterium]
DHDGHIRDYWFTDEIDERLDELLESLERKDMVRRRDESRLRGHEEYYFKHRIERRSVYGDIPAQTKQRYHRLVAQWLDRTVEEGGDRIAEQIAEHYDKGHCLDRAAKKYIRAGEYAAARFANQKAVDLFTKGLGYLSDADMELKLSAFHDLGTVYDRRGEYDQSLAYFREMLRYSWLLNDTSKAGAALNKIGRAYRGLGEYDDALENLERALDLFWVDSDLRGVASTLDDIGKIHWIRGDYEEALGYYSAGLELRRDTAHQRSIALSLSNLGSLHLQRGELNEAMGYYREALELRQAIEDREGVADSYNTLGALCLERGDTDDAITLFEEALEIARDIGHRILIAQYLNNLGEAYLKARRFDEADECLEEARDEAERSGDKRIIFDVLRNLSRVALNRETFELADERIDEALALADELESQALLGEGKQTQADIYAAWCRAEEFDDEERADRTEERYREAIELLREVGNQAKLGRCFRRFGNFLLDRGDAVRGKQNLERAREIFERLEIRKLREATEQAIHQI